VATTKPSPARTALVLSPATKKLLQQIATAEHRTMSQQITVLVEQAAATYDSSRLK
jgi:hypothetical protein